MYAPPPFSLTAYGPLSHWVTFYDQGMNTQNEYSERLYGSSYYGSGLCILSRVKFTRRRTTHGSIPIEQKTMIYPTEYTLVKGRHTVDLYGTAWLVDDIMHGDDITSRRVAKLVREIG